MNTSLRAILHHQYVTSGKHELHTIPTIRSSELAASFFNFNPMAFAPRKITPKQVPN
jgi:hypothetical protein